VRLPPTLIVIGGLLGAGKTTLALAAARQLTAAGRRVGIVTNDQGSGLVDTALARVERVAVSEVSGGCFCCRLSDLLRATDALAAHDPDVIFAEPVGSCLDLAATVLRPILRDESARFRVAPLTVLVDPARAHQLATGCAASDLAFLFHHQLAEADIVCYSKADLEVPMPAGSAPAHLVSARTGAGVADWLNLVMGAERPAARAQLHVDYQRYAEAEAALAWLNWRVELRVSPPLSPAVVVGTLMDRLEASLRVAGLDIVHVKVLDQTPTGYVRASLVAAGEPPAVDGTLDASPAARHDLLLNARAIGDPARLSEVVASALDMGAVEVNVCAREAFRPAAPTPERRA
jgi:Ni2+-binding GTPase involved in maturation of urease and hydrogenase